MTSPKISYHMEHKNKLKIKSIFGISSQGHRNSHSNTPLSNRKNITFSCKLQFLVFLMWFIR